MTEIERAPIDRRSGIDRRKIFSFSRFFYRGEEKRGLKERRLQAERRDDWVRVRRWASVFLRDLKIAKFLK